MENFKNYHPENKDTEPFDINPETGKLISHGHEYEDIPRMRHLIEKANAIRSSISPVPTGFSRLWRANRPGEVGKNPSYTNSLEGIALPFSEGYSGKISYVDLPDTDLDKYVREGAVAPGAEFILPADIVEQAKVVEGIDSEEEISDLSFNHENDKPSFGDPV